MRRFLAILLLALLGGDYAVPLLQAASSDPDAHLPACCRRNGKHHCAMMDQYLQHSGKPVWSAPAQHCPLYRRGLPQLWSPFGIAVLPSRASAIDSIQTTRIYRAQLETQYRVSYDRARLKRGPPSISL